MLSKLKSWLFGDIGSNKQHDVVVITTPRMVGEPVLSFVKCLKATPNRFKLKCHSYKEATDSANWPTVYHWMAKDGTHTGFASLTDRKDGSTYYAIIHKGRLYSINGLNFDLNGWEMNFISDAFIYEFRKKARNRKEKMLQTYWEKYRMQKDQSDKAERLKLAEKFK